MSEAEEEELRKLAAEVQQLKAAGAAIERSLVASRAELRDLQERLRKLEKLTAAADKA